MRKLNSSLLTGLAATSLLCMASGVWADGQRNFRAALIGYEEVPAVSTGASGTLLARIAEGDGSIDFELSYQGIEGGNATAAHIHVGQRGANGGVSAFLCGGGRPACPATGGTVMGTIFPEDVIGPVGEQQVAAGGLDELIAAIRAGVTYANVHSPASSGGEIRGQLRPGSPGDGN